MGDFRSKLGGLDQHPWGEFLFVRWGFWDKLPFLPVLKIMKTSCPVHNSVHNSVDNSELVL